MIAGGVVSVVVLIALFPFVLVSNAMGTCTGYLMGGVEGLYITGELGGWGLLFVGLVIVVLKRRMPYLWSHQGRGRRRGRGQSKLYLVFGGLVLLYIVAFWGLSQFTPPACATLPSERLWPWLGGLIPW